MDLEEIKNKAGFHDLAHIPLTVLTEMEVILAARREAGERLDIEPEDDRSRYDFRAVFPAGRSVYVAFEQIPFERKLSAPRAGYGRLAGISRDVDYHLLLKHKIEVLQALLEEADPTIRCHRQIDTGPLYERGFAARTGRGFIGRNGNFIHRELGSYVTIGLLLVDRDCDGAAEIETCRCGSCMRCVRACPGGAIDPSGRLSPTRCRSWLSQKRGPLSEREREILADSLYGCDICQAVCPFNADIPARFQTKNPRTYIPLDEVEAQSNRTFRENFGHMSGAWRGARQWKKNAEYIRAYFKDRKR
ncbi:epoxyqueuosine reductase [Peptoniphilus ivorii]|uniref:epoxyqueuosine reductase n=1 Tax=Aedoeadaptatus ivorii TaxID=54006 RepID=UPI002789E7C5|nr:4Fe-4S double cluster binding domain-containing protein [Peptoniphilus ivorii]MDQ0508067.1 epoxyqueuosine reductase [Peptoniphilus ivorii]